MKHYPDHVFTSFMVKLHPVASVDYPDDWLWEVLTPNHDGSTAYTWATGRAEDEDLARKKAEAACVRLAGKARTYWSPAQEPQPEPPGRQRHGTRVGPRDEPEQTRKLVPGDPFYGIL